jgi:hypothetical protein
MLNCLQIPTVPFARKNCDGGLAFVLADIPSTMSVLTNGFK